MICLDAACLASSVAGLSYSHLKVQLYCLVAFLLTNFGWSHLDWQIEALYSSLIPHLMRNSSWISLRWTNKRWDVFRAHLNLITYLFVTGYMKINRAKFLYLDFKHVEWNTWSSYQRRNITKKVPVNHSTFYFSIYLVINYKRHSIAAN